MHHGKRKAAKRLSGRYREVDSEDTRKAGGRFAFARRQSSERQSGKERFIASFAKAHPPAFHLPSHEPSEGIAKAFPGYISGVYIWCGKDDAHQISKNKSFLCGGLGTDM